MNPLIVLALSGTSNGGGFGGFNSSSRNGSNTMLQRLEADLDMQRLMLFAQLAVFVKDLNESMFGTSNSSDLNNSVIGCGSAVLHIAGKYNNVIEEPLFDRNWWDRIISPKESENWCSLTTTSQCNSSDGNLIESSGSYNTSFTKLDEILLRASESSNPFTQPMSIYSSESLSDNGNSFKSEDIPSIDILIRIESDISDYLNEHVLPRVRMKFEHLRLDLSDRLLKRNQQNRKRKDLAEKLGPIINGIKMRRFMSRMKEVRRMDQEELEH